MILTKNYIPFSQDSPKNPSLQGPGSHWPDVCSQIFPASLFWHWHTMNKKQSWFYLTCLYFTFWKLIFHKIWESFYLEWYWQKITYRFHTTLRRIHPCKDLDHTFQMSFHKHFQLAYFDIGKLSIENKDGHIWLAFILLI